jgi:UPF0755 protein
MRKKLLIGLLLIGSLMIVLGVTLSQLADKPSPLAAKRDVVLPEGTGIIEIGKLMEKEGVVESRYFFPFFYVLLEFHRPLKAGEYEFAAGASYRQVMSTLGSGITVVRKFTVPEGITVAQVYKLLQENPALKGNVPSNVAEGTLLPETYYYSYGDSRAWLIERMQKSHEKFMSEVWPKRASNLPFTTQQEALTLASIVEKETGLSGERGKVAAVFINRLHKGMKLQADPTVIYGITKGQNDLGRSITRADLNTPTPYNTYTIPGLPPTPITNPGKDSIHAVLNPLDTKDLFFVADGKGGHSFSESYAQHDQNVTEYRKQIKKEVAPKQPAREALPAALPPKKKKVSAPKSLPVKNQSPAAATPAQ